MVSHQCLTIVWCNEAECLYMCMIDESVLGVHASVYQIDESVLGVHASGRGGKQRLVCTTCHSYSLSVSSFQE